MRFGALIGAAALLTAGCGQQESPAATPAPKPSGRFVVEYEPATGANAAERKFLQDRQVLEDFADTMNGYVRIPRDVRVTGAVCDESNAFYEPDEHQIKLCYELLGSERQTFAEAGDEPKVVADEVYESTVGTLYHEAGHALIGELGLKITGREEDVADQMAAYVLASDDEYKSFLVTVADSYALSADHAKTFDDLPFYDTHSLDAQRSVNFFCYAYGADPKTFQYLVDDGSLPKERAEGCGDEYKQLSDAWEALLAPYVK